MVTSVNDLIKRRKMEAEAEKLANAKADGSLEQFINHYQAHNHNICVPLNDKVAQTTVLLENPVNDGQRIVPDTAVRVFPPSTEMFLELLGNMRDISLAKGHDYSGSDDPMSNFRMCEAMGLPAWKGIVVRLGDKLSRIQNFCKKESLQVKDESVEDTLIDMANYALLCIIMYRESRNKGA